MGLLYSHNELDLEKGWLVGPSFYTKASVLNVLDNFGNVLKDRLTISEDYRN